MSQQLQNLGELISAGFDREELRNLYLDLGIDHEEAPGEGKRELVRYLILVCQQQGKLLELVTRCGELRPTFKWPDHSDNELYETAILPLLKGYADEINDIFVTFWNEHVAFGDDNLQFLEERQPLESIFFYESLEQRRSEPAFGSSDKDEEKANKKDDKGKDTSERSIEELSSLKLAYAALRNSLPQGERGSVTLLIAEPGAGKTLWLRYLATQIAGDIEEPAFPIPIYLPLNVYRGEEDLGSFISSILAANEQHSFHQQMAITLGTVMKRRQLLLLMDGLNEISETSVDGMSQKRRFARALYAYVNEHHAVCLVASRETDFAAGLDWPEIKIHPLDRMGVIRCLHNYAPEDAPDIYRILDEKNLFGTLTSNPYRVRALCQIYKSGSGLPENLGTLFGAFVATLVNLEKERRISQGMKWEPFESWAPSASELARHLVDSEATAIEQSWLGQYSQDVEYWSYAEGAGLLRFRNNRVQFGHQQMQEYFAALWLKIGLESYGLEWDGFSAALKTPAWDEPLFLLAGLAGASLLDQLIEPMAKVDPFLACRCVGIDPTKVSTKTRQWLAMYIEKGLSFAEKRGDSELVTELVRCAGEMRCDESLRLLTQPDATFPRLSARAVFYRAIAQANTVSAANFLAEAIEQAAGKRPDYWRETVLDITRDLASMTVPEAKSFLARSLYDRRIYKEVLVVVGEVDAKTGYRQLKTLLEHNQFWDSADERFYFPSLASAAANVAPRALLSDLLCHVDQPAAVEMLLRLDAGQRIINEYVDHHNYIVGRQKMEADGRVFGIFDDYFRRYTSLIDLRNYLYRDVGEKAAEEFVDLLIKVVSYSQDNQDRRAAIMALAIMRIIRALPALKALQESISSPDEKNLPPRDLAGKDADELKYFLERAIDFLEEPRGIQVSERYLDRFAISMRAVWPKLDGKTIPKSTKELLDWAREDQEQFGKFAVLTLTSAQDWLKKDLWFREYSHGECVRSAAQFLSEQGGSALADLLLPLLVAVAEDDHWNRRRRMSVVIDLMIEHGLRGIEQKRSIINCIASLVRRPNKHLQFAAIKVLALLDANEHCGQWVEYLSDRTWPLAYMVVDALGSMTTTKSTHDLLVSRLGSVSADERYFAVLALGSIGRKEHLSQVLKLGSDANVEVRRAVLWAVSQIGIGVSSQDVVQVLSDGITSPHSRLRREAANTIGGLRIADLNNELRNLLEDADLRVVERAAWAMGQLEDRESVNRLMKALEGVTWRNEWNYQPGLRQRVEYRVKATIITSLAQIRVGVSEDAILERIEKGDRMLKAFVAGRLGQRTWRELDRRVEEYPWEPAGTEPAIQHQDLEVASRPELESAAWYSANPMERKRAIELLGEDVESYESYYVTIPRHDPLPVVQLEALKIRATLNSDHNPTESFIGNPKYDLMLVRELSDIRPEMTVHIPLPESWHAGTALWLAQRFSRDYELEMLISKLFESLEKPHGLGFQEIRALCVLPERRKLVRFCLGSMGLRPEWPEDLLLPRSDCSWLPSVGYLLAQRRVWGAVPHLIENLGDERMALNAIQALCEMGVYQAADLIQESGDRLKPDKDTQVAVAQVMAKVELKGHFGENLPDRINGVNFDDGYQWPLFCILSNILAESDSAQDIEEGMRLEARLSSGYNIGEYTDITWLDRRLQRWGQEYLRVLLQALADSGLSYTIEEICGSLMPYDREGAYLSKRAEQIARAVRRCPGDILLEWLEDSSWAVRLVAFCGLASAHSDNPDSYLERFLKDDNSQVFLALLRRARKDRFPMLFSFLEGETDLGLPDGKNEHMLLALHDAVEKHLAGADHATKRAIISILGERRSIRFASILSSIALSDDPDTAIVALAALRKIGDRSQATSIRPLLGSLNPGVLRSAIETVAILRHRPASDRLIQLLEHPDLEIQNAAVGACGLMQIRKAIPQLKQRLISVKGMLPVADGTSPTERDLPDENKALRDATESELFQAVETTECALLLLRAGSHLSFESIDYISGDGLLALFALHEYYKKYLHPELRYDRGERFKSDLPYPLSLLEIEDSRLLIHAIRRDLRAANWMNRTTREAILASTSLFSNPPELESSGASAFSGVSRGIAFSGHLSPTGEEVVDLWVTTILTTVESIESRMTEGWNQVRAHWHDDVAGVDLSSLPDGLEPVSSLATVKAIIVSFFDHLLNRDIARNNNLAIPIDVIHEGVRLLLELGLFAKNSDLAMIFRMGSESSETDDALDDEARQLWDGIVDIDRQFLEQCQHIAKLYITCSLIASWGHIVLHRFQELFSDIELGASYFDRVNYYLWIAQGIIDGVPIISDDTKISGEKVNPLASMDS